MPKRQLLKVTYDREADAAYIPFTSAVLDSGRDTILCETPDDVEPGAIIALDWKDGKIVGLEVVGASFFLHQDLLDSASVKD